MVLLLLAAGPLVAFELAPELAARISGGDAIVLLRHGNAPGEREPPDFSLTDCDHQRNMDALGREQARALGHLLRAAGIESAHVYTSAFCRCRETAALLELGDPQIVTALNSFHGYSGDQEEKLAALDSFLRSVSDGEDATIVVTHQEIINTLTDVIVPSAGAVVVTLDRDRRVLVLGVLDPPEVP